MRAKLTEEMIKGLQKPVAADLVIHDTACPGLTLRWRKNATAPRWYVMCGVRGEDNRRSMRWSPLGSMSTWPALSYKAAQRLAKIAIAALAEGRDPNEARSAEARAKREAREADTAARKAERESITVRQAWIRWAWHYRRELRPSTWRDYRWCWRQCIAPHLGALKVKDVTTSDVERMRLALLETKGAATTRKALAVTSMLFAVLMDPKVTGVLFPIKKDEQSTGAKVPLLSSNPAKGGKRYMERPRIEPRQDYLDRSQVAALLTGLRFEPEVWQLFWTTALLAPLRRGNIAAARWSDIDLTAGSESWKVKATAAKGKREINLPIATRLAEMLRRWRDTCRSDSPWIFPAGLTAGPRAGTGHIVAVQHAWRRAMLLATAVRLSAAIASAAKQSPLQVLEEFRADLEGLRTSGWAGRAKPGRGQRATGASPLDRAVANLKTRAEAMGIPTASLIVTGFRPHDLRRTAASWAAQGGESMAVISKALAHAGTAITEAHYAHLADAPVRGMVNANADRLLNAEVL